MIPCVSLNSHSFNNHFIDTPISAQLVAQEIAYVIDMARHQGQNLEDLVSEILDDDPILDSVQRRWLSNIIIQAWKNLPYSPAKNFSTDNYLHLNHRDTSLSTTVSTS